MNKAEKVASIYKRTNVMQLGSIFICNCNITLHVWDAFCVHLQEHLEIVEALVSDMRRGEVSNKASKVDGIHTKSYWVPNMT